MNDLTAYGEYQGDHYISQKNKVIEPVNHLNSEINPFYIAHKSDPVGWYSWSDEAFNAAKVQDKPLFVCVGYYSHHWCHVMSRECFCDYETAGMINDACIPVLVDREERPDIDLILTEACRLQNGSAGYPLNIFMTPDGMPFFCTTWLPKRTTGKMPGLTELLPRIKWLWVMQRQDIDRSANELNSLLSERIKLLSGQKSSRLSKVRGYEALNDLRKIFDVVYGGFGGTPKFPEPCKLLFMLTSAKLNHDKSSREFSDSIAMTDITMRRMWRGGIHDHLGGGFSNSAVDERWIVPHFEKLLAEQALLLLAASKAHELTNNDGNNMFYRLFAEDIIFSTAKYFVDDASFSQGFKASVDGDTDSGEGKYYLWTDNEIKKILPEGIYSLFCAAYGVLPSGNYAGEVGGAQMGQNILYEASNITDLMKRYGLKGNDITSRLSEARKLLLNARDNRFPLKSDNKIILGYNVADKSGNYYRIWVDGKLSVNAQLDDYAYFLWGLIELYNAAKFFEAGQKQLDDWLKTITEFADKMISVLWDEKNSGFFMTDGKDKKLLFRIKSAEDFNSIPSPNSMACIALTELGLILEEKKYTDYAEKIIENFSRYASDNSLMCLTLITANNLYKPAKKKPLVKPEPKPVLTDEELNKPEEITIQEPVTQKEPESRTSTHRRRQSRTSRRRER